MRKVEVFNNDTCRWDTYFIGQESEFGKPIKVKKARKQRKYRNRKQTIKIPRYIDEVVLEFPYDVDVNVEYIYC